MQYVIDPTADEPIMVLNKHIGLDEDEGMGIDSSLFQQELLQLDGMGKKRIKIYINSPGGDVDGGMAIYHAILSTKTKVDTYNVFMCASMAAVILQAGAVRYMNDYSLLMFHAPYFVGTGDEKQDADTKALLALYKQSAVKSISARVHGKSEADIDKMLNKDSWFDATEAMANGFIDVIQDSAEYNKKRSTPAERSNPKALFAKGNKIMASLFNTNITHMKIVAKKLGLNAEASEDAIADAVAKLQSESVTMKKKMEDDDSEMSALKKKLSDAEEDCKTMKAKIEKAEKTAKEKADKDKEDDDKAKGEKAKALVATHVKAGRIKNDAKVIAFYEKAATEDFDNTSETLEAMNINKKSTEIPTLEEGKIDIKMAGSAAARMIGISAQHKQKVG